MDASYINRKICTQFHAYYIYRRMISDTRSFLRTMRLIRISILVGQVWETLTLERDIDEHFGRSSRYLVRISRPFRGSGDSSQASNTVDVTILRRGWLRFCETAKSNLLSGTKGMRRGRVCRVLIEFRWTEIGTDQLLLPETFRGTCRCY